MPKIRLKQGSYRTELVMLRLQPGLGRLMLVLVRLKRCLLRLILDPIRLKLLMTAKQLGYRLRIALTLPRLKARAALAGYYQRALPQWQ